MADEVKLYASAGGSPYVFRVEIALNLKGITYEDLTNKSVDFLKYNPVHKQVPVLLNNGKPISESLVIVEYIDDVWQGVPILPQDPYEKAVARFWTKFIDDTCIPATFKVFGNIGDDQVLAEAYAKLQILENELIIKDKKFFGGDNINVIDISAAYIAYSLGILEEITEIKIVTQQKFPNITEWADNFILCPVVKEVLPPKWFIPKAEILEYFKNRYGKA